MIAEKLIKRYFYNTEIEEWNYPDFKKYVKMLGYKNENDVVKIYNRILNEFADYRPNDYGNTVDSAMSSTESLRKSKRKEFEKENQKVIFKNIYNKYEQTDKNWYSDILAKYLHTKHQLG